MAKTLSREALAQLRSHPWPCNVRELKKQRAFIMAGELIDVDSLPPDFGKGQAPPGFSSKDLPIGLTIAEAERRLILATLAHCDSSKEKTAQMLGISLKTLYNRLRDYGSA
ncbi:MAG: helix-turn-helix domain-containing protein [Gammaproteobacteria bacterium]